tara:strand:+ start:3679 stop:3930 length:252 start_codon:yes stop_codon:yes gene_type:complete
MSDNTETKKTNEWAEREIGALWKREGSNQKYLSGKLKVEGQEVGVVVFTNRHKAEGSNQPDFRMYRDKPMEKQEVQSNQEEVL